MPDRLKPFPGTGAIDFSKDKRGNSMVRGLLFVTAARNVGSSNQIAAKALSGMTSASLRNGNSVIDEMHTPILCVTCVLVCHKKWHSRLDSPKDGF